MGHTYGDHPVWQFYAGKPSVKAKVPVPDVAPPRMTWQEALKLPVANQMKHFRTLFEGVDFASFRPDNTWLRIGHTVGLHDHEESSVGRSRSKLCLRVHPNWGNTASTLRKLTSDQVHADWFNPRAGETVAIGRIENQGIKSFDPPESPSAGNEWVLCLYEKAKE